MVPGNKTKVRITVKLFLFQWVLGHLTDEHLEAFFVRCIKVRAWSFLVRFPNSLASGHPGTRQLGNPTRSFYFVPWSSSDLNAISQGLKPGGFLVVKENVTSSGEVSCCNANVFCQGFVNFHEFFVPRSKGTMRTVQ